MSDTDLLRTEAEELLTYMQQAPPREAGEPLRWQDKSRILELHEQGLTQVQIAEEMCCHQSTVSRTLADLDDSRGFARKLLHANAVTIVENILSSLKTATLADQMKLLAKLETVIPDDRPAVSGNQLTVIVGMPGAPVRLPTIPSERPALPDTSNAA